MNWTYDDIDEKRFQSALKLKPQTLDNVNASATFKGSSELHTCTLEQCDCIDFHMNLHGKKPCKHIIALGIAMGAFNPDELSHRFEAARVKDVLAHAYGRYYLFNDPAMSDEEYDALKAAWPDIFPAKLVEGVLDFDSIDSLTPYLDTVHVTYIDKRANGGRFWIISTPKSDEICKIMTVANAHPVYAASTSTFGGKPGWYFR